MEFEDVFMWCFYGLFGLVFLFLIGSGVFYFVGWHMETGRGEHTGYITAIERGGVFFKTSRAYLKTDTQSSQEDAYCVTDPQVYEQLQEMSTKKTHINAYFFTWFAAGIASCDGKDAVIYKIEPLTN